MLNHLSISKKIKSTQSSKPPSKAFVPRVSYGRFIITSKIVPTFRMNLTTQRMKLAALLLLFRFFNIV